MPCHMPYTQARRFPDRVPLAIVTVPTCLLGHQGSVLVPAEETRVKEAKEHARGASKQEVVDDASAALAAFEVCHNDKIVM
jgi:hypothetical protein